MTDENQICEAERHVVLERLGCEDPEQALKDLGPEGIAYVDQLVLSARQNVRGWSKRIAERILRGRP